ncbi:hypothetical protein AB0F13_14545 [Streptomyces sp. NPDC026206]|uniref:hypothetical protein n=1 Tax=Streptomyces sp. NPDC026206 TaxID=3157089 RepID=UPI0033E95BED
MNEIIPPSDEWERGRLERKADALLKAARAEPWENWPGFWPNREESEFERIAAAHTGMVPLVVASLVAALSDLDPESGFHAMRGLMQERPGMEPSDPLSQVLDNTTESSTYGSGFTMERRNSPPDGCQWEGCAKPLYAPGAARKPGRPSKYCEPHKRAAKAHTRRRRYAGVRVGRNRNLVYAFDGLKEQDLTGYRQIWARVNTARV